MRVIAAVTIALLLITTAAAEIEFRDDEDVQYHTGIDMNQNPLIGLPDPEADSEPVPFGFLSQQYVAREGDSMEGNLEMQGNVIDMEDGEIEDASQIETTDISGLNFLVPDEELQITEDVDIGGDLDVEGGIEFDGELESEMETDLGTYFQRKYIGNPGMHSDYVVLLQRSDGSDHDFTQGEFQMSRHMDSTNFMNDRVRVNIKGDRSGRNIGSLDVDYGAERSNVNGFRYVEVEYGGDPYVALEFSADSQHRSHSRGIYFTGIASSAGPEKLELIEYYDNSDDEVLNEEVHDSIEELSSEGRADSRREIQSEEVYLEGETEIDDDLEVSGETEFEDTIELSGGGTSSNDYDGTVIARNFGYTPTGASQYLLGQSGDRQVRWRDSLVSVYDSLEVGDGYGTNSPDYTLDIHGESRIRDDLQIDGDLEVDGDNTGTKTAEDFETIEEFEPTNDAGPTGEYQSWEVPETGTYRITAEGAKGGISGRWSPIDHHYGAKARGDFFLEEGDEIIMVVGQMGNEGTDSSGSSGGGGGGTFVTREVSDSDYEIEDGDYEGTTIEPLVVAGGGAGAIGGCDKGHGSDSRDGNNGIIHENVFEEADEQFAHANYMYLGGGKEGEGGNSCDPNDSGDCDDLINFDPENDETETRIASAGGGFLSDGDDGGREGSDSASGGEAFLNGAEGGRNEAGRSNRHGGFGGGGAGVNHNVAGTPGGGWSGGGPGVVYYTGDRPESAVCGGGGGSYNDGDNALTEAGASDGPGHVKIEY